MQNETKRNKKSQNKKITEENLSSHGAVYVLTEELNVLFVCLLLLFL